MSIFCTNCGQALPDGSKFCLNCGTKVVVQNNKKITTGGNTAKPKEKQEENSSWSDADRRTVAGIMVGTYLAALEIHNLDMYNRLNNPNVRPKLVEFLASYYIKSGFQGEREKPSIPDDFDVFVNSLLTDSTSVSDAVQNNGGNGTTSLTEFRQNAVNVMGYRDELLTYRKSLANAWDYNAYVGILLGVSGPKHGDQACMNFAIGQGDNGNNTKKTLESKGLMPIFEKYKGKKLDSTTTLDEVEDEIIHSVPEYRAIRDKIHAILDDGTGTITVNPPISKPEPDTVKNDEDKNEDINKGFSFEGRPVTDEDYERYPNLKKLRDCYEKWLRRRRVYSKKIIDSKEYVDLTIHEEQSNGVFCSCRSKIRGSYDTKLFLWEENDGLCNRIVNISIPSGSKLRLEDIKSWSQGEDISLNKFQRMVGLFDYEIKDKILDEYRGLLDNLLWHLSNNLKKKEFDRKNEYFNYASISFDELKKNIVKEIVGINYIDEQGKSMFAAVYPMKPGCKATGLMMVIDSERFADELAQFALPKYVAVDYKNTENGGWRLLVGVNDIDAYDKHDWYYKFNDSCNMWPLFKCEGMTSESFKNFVPTLKNCKQYGISESIGQRSEIEIILHEGDGINEERYYKGDDLNPYKKLYNKISIKLKIDFYSVYHPKYQGMKAYCLTENAIYYEMGGEIYCDRSDGKSYRISAFDNVNVGGENKGVMSMEAKNGKLYVNFFEGLYQTRFNEEISYCGDLCSKFVDVYKVTTEQYCIKTID